MDLRLSAEDRDFRRQVQDFLRASLPDELRDKHDASNMSSRDQSLAWQRILHRKGWAAPHWPRHHGGTGWTPTQRFLFEEECTIAGAPSVNIQGMTLVGPVINEFGSDQQHNSFIRPLLNGETFWCQGFSEPNAGSDLSALQTSAVLDGGHYVVNGGKIWTTKAHMADWIFLLVRTSRGSTKQEGISFLLADMRSSGIRVRPIISIDGLHHLNEVTFDNVRVPAENLVGKEGQGWIIAKFLLGNERAFGSTDLPVIKRDLHRIAGVLSTRRNHDRSHALTNSYADRFTHLQIMADALQWCFLKTISEEQGTSADGWLMGSVLKLQATELHQAVTELLFDMLGDRGPVFCPNPSKTSNIALGNLHERADLSRVSAELMYRRAASIYGGTNEIQRNLIARSVLR